jgi:hypothetical protein
MACPICNKEEPPRMPPGFTVDTDKSGSRHEQGRARA